MSDLSNTNQTDNVKMLSSKEAAKRLGCAPDYVSKLCREKKLVGEMVDSAWFVSEKSLTEFETVRELAQVARAQKLSQQRKQEQEQFKKINAPEAAPVLLAAPISSPQVAAPYQASFFLKTGAVALGVLFMFSAVVFARATNSNALFATNTGPQGAALAQVQSPFFGEFSSTAVDEQTYRTSDTGFFGKIFAFLFGSRTSTIAQSTPVVPSAPSKSVVATLPAAPIKKPVTVAPSAPASTQTIIQNKTYPVIERTIVETKGGISQAQLTLQLNALEGTLRQLINSNASSQFGILYPPGGNYGGSGNSQVVYALNNLAIIGGTITGANITGGTISAGSLAGITGIANGGTGLGVAPGLGQLLLGNASGGYSLVSTSSLGISSGSASFVGLVGAPSSLTLGDLLYASATDTLSALPKGSNGQVLKIIGGLPVWGTDIQGGGGGSSAWATTTDSLAVYTTDPTQVVIIGNSATTTAGNILEVTGNALFRNQLTAYRTVTAPNFVATSTTLASIFPYASTTALTVSGTGYFGNASTSNLTVSNTPNSLLSTDATGAVGASSISAPLSFSGGTLSINQSGVASNGYLSSTNFNIFNNKISSSSLSGGTGINYDSSTGIISNTGVVSLAATYPLISSGSTGALTLTTAFGTTTANTFSALNTFNGGILANAATTTSFAITNVTSSLLKTLSNGAVVAAVAGIDYQAPGNYATFAYPFPGNATTTQIAFNGGATFAGATTTSFTVNGSSTVGGQFNALGGATFGAATINTLSLVNSLSVANGGTGSTTLGGLLTGNGAGAVAAANVSGPLTFSGNTLAINQASLSQNGFLNTADFANFNNKISSSSLSAVYPLAYNSGTGVFTTAFSTTTTNVFSALNTFNGGATISNLTLGTALSVANGGTGTSTAPGYGKLLLGNNAGGYDLVSTSSLGIISGGGGSSFGQAFEINPFGALSPTTTIGIAINASSTIGNGTQAGGLTISGGATTTGIAYFATNVGIGNSTPLKTLDVTGTGRFTSTLTLGSVLSCTGGQALQTDASGNIICGTLASGGASSGGGWTTNNNGLVTLATSTDMVTVGASSTPYAKFAVLSGASGTTTLALVPSSGQTANILDIYDTSGGLSSVFTSAGNFGIGTTSPFAKLSVAGNALVSGVLTAATVNANNLVATNATTTNATTTAFAITSLTSTLLKTNAQGSLVPAIAGTDYQAAGNYATFAYLFPGNATSTQITFSGGLVGALTGNASTATALQTSRNINGVAFNGTADITVTAASSTHLADSNTFTGSNVFSGNLLFGFATTTNFAITGTPSALLKTLSNGAVVAAIAGTDYLTSATTFAYPFPSNATTTQIAFNGGATFAGATTTALAVTGSTTISSLLSVGGVLNANGGVVGNLTGNASTATALQTGRTINGITFDGTANITINAASSTLLANSNTFSGSNTFTSTINGNISGNAATVTTNANLSGVVTSVGNATSLGSFTSANLAAALTDETGTGAAVFGTGASLTNTTLASTTLSGNSLFAFATTTNFAITGTPSALLKTLSNGAVVAAIAGTDYLTAANVFAYPFPGNATSTLLGFNGGFISSASSTFSGVLNAGTVNLAGLANAVLAVNSTGQIIGTTSIGVSNLTGVLPVANGGTASTSLTGILKGNGTGAVGTLVVGSGLTFDGTTLATNGAGITAIGPTGQTQTGGTQIFATSTSGTDFSITASSNTQTFNFPFASLSSNGKLSSADYATFTGKLGSTSLSGQSVISYNPSSGVITTQGGTFGAGNYVFPGNVNVTGNASSSLFSANGAYFGSTATSSFASNGALTLAQALGISSGGTGNTSFATNSLLYFDGTKIAATSSGPLYVGSLTATTTSATSTLLGGFAAANSLFVLQNGNVGIGNSTPLKTLDVTGTGRFSSTLTLSNTLSCAGNQALQTDVQGNIACGTISTASLSTAGGWSTTNVGVVGLATTSDLVAIGATSTPYAKLSILSGGAATTTLALVPASGQTANIIDIYNTSGSLSSVLTAGGNLGLGTTSPFAKLSVHGNGYFAGNVSATNITATGTLTVAGKVGIGTTTPQSLLSVVGGNITHTASGNPTLAATVAEGGSTHTYGTYVSGHYAYTADYEGGLRILDVTNPKLPSVVGSNSSYTGSPLARAVAVSGKYAYVADENAGLFIFDVSNTASPTVVGTYAIGGVSDSVVVSGKYAFINDFNNHATRIIDVSNPALPTLAGSYTSPSQEGPGSPLGLAVQGKYLYIADFAPAIYIVDISRPAAPVLVGTYHNLTNASAPHAVYVSGKYLYVADEDKGLYALDVSNPASPSLAGNYPNNRVGHYYGVQVAGNYAYVADHSNSTTNVIDISNIAAPSLVGSYSNSGLPNNIFVSGKYAYVSGYDQGLDVVDINGFSTPAANIGSLAANTADISDNANVGGDIFAGGGINAGLSGIFSRGGLSVVGTSTLGAPLTVTGLGTFTNLFSTGSSTIGGAFNSVTSNILGSTTLLGNSLFAFATTTNFAITGTTNALLKTLSNGAVVAAVAGTDYVTGSGLASAYPFPNNATTTQIAFNGGLTATTLNVSTSATLASTTLSGNSLFGFATTTNFAITGTPSALLKTLSNGAVVAAIAGTDYLTSATTFAYPFPSNATTTQIAFNGGATFAGATTTALAVTGSSTISGVFNALGTVNLGVVNGTSFTGTGTGLTGTASGLSIGGNALTATTLQTSRNINGVAFNGSADITVTAAAGTLTGTTLNSTVVNSSLTSVGTLGSLAVSGLSTLTGGILTNASSTLGNFTANFATTSQATTTNFAITSVPSALLKTLSNGAVVAAIAGTDYLTSATTFAYPFPGNATTTQLAFNGGATFAGATTTALAVTGSTTLTSLLNVGGALNANGTLTVLGGTSLQGATSTSLAVTGSTTISGQLNALGNANLGSVTVTGSSTIVGQFNATGGATFGTLTGNSINANSFTGGGGGLFGTAVSLSIGGNAFTATKLLNSRNINGVAFNGTADITVTAASSTLLSDSNTFTGSNTFNAGLTANILTVGTSATLASTTLSGNSLFNFATTTNFAITGTPSALLKTLSNGAVVAAIAGTDYATPSNVASAFPFTPTTFGATASNATSTLIGFTNGLYALASSTIGGGSQTSGLTINGGATTTGNAYFGSSITGKGVLSVNSGNDSLIFGNGAIGLVVQGTNIAAAYFSNAPYTVRVADSNSYNAGIYTTDGTNIAALSDTNDSAAIYLSGGTYGVYAPTAGNKNYFAGSVGIGTTSPYAKLSVAGNIVGTNITATGTLSVAGGTTLAAATSSSLAVTGSTTISGAFNSVSSNLLGSTTLLGNSLFAFATTTNFAITGTANTLLKTLSNGAVVAAIAGTDYQAAGNYATFAFPYTPSTFGATASNATSTLIGFTNGLYSLASSTIGGGSQTTGLTISGGATTTGNAYFGGTVGIGTTTPWARLSVDSSNLGTSAAFSIGSSTNTLFTVGNGGNTSVFGTLSASTTFTLTAQSATNTISTSNGISGSGGSGSLSITTGAPFGSGLPGNITISPAGSSGSAAKVFITGGDGINNGGNVTVQGGGGGITNGNVLLNPTLGNVGVGTTSPFATLSVFGLSGTTNKTLFAIGSSTGTFATSTLFSVSNTGLVTGNSFSFTSGTTSALAVTGSTTVTGKLNAYGGAGFAAATIANLTTTDVTAITPTSASLNGINFTIPSGLTGTGLNFSNGYVTSGNIISISQTDSGSGSPFTGKYINVTHSRTEISGSDTESGNFLNLARTNANNTGGQTLTVTGDLATLSSNCVQNAGSCTDTSSILSLAQYAANSGGGPVLKILSGGSGNLATLNATSSAANGVSIQIASTSNNAFAFNILNSSGASTFLVSGNGNGSFGSTSPFAQVSIHANNGNTNTTLFAIGSSTSAFATTTLFSVSNTGSTTIAGPLGVTSSATSTFAAGVNISAGCFAINGVCLPSASGSGITAIGPAGQTQTGPTVTQATSSTGTDFTITATGNVITFNLPSASASNRGLLTSSDWTLFNSKAGLTTNTFTGLQQFNGGASTTQLSVFNQAYFGATATSTFTSTGALGIGTTTPWGLLSINPVAGNTQPSFVIGSSTITQFIVTNGGNVGVGTTSPYARFSVSQTAAVSQFSLAYDNSTATDFRTDATGNLWMVPQGSAGGNVLMTNDNLWVCTGGSITSNTCPSGTPSGKGNLIVQNKISIGTTTPTSQFTIASSTTAGIASFVSLDTATSPRLIFGDVASTTRIALDNSNGVFRIFSSKANDGSAATLLFNIDGGSGYVGIGTTSPSQQLSISQKLYVGAGNPSVMGTATSTFQGDVLITGKLDVSTIDPVYTIDGTKYATYGVSGVGVKEEVSDTITLKDKNTDGKYSYDINFNNLEKGSDFWLFYQVTTFGTDMKNLVANLTPGFDGTVYYTKDPATNTLHIVSSAPGEVSVRLISTRFDAAQWSNIRPDQNGGFAGFQLQSK